MSGSNRSGDSDSRIQWRNSNRSETRNTSAAVGLGRDGGNSDSRGSASVGLGRDGGGSESRESVSTGLWSRSGSGSGSGSSEGSGGNGSPASDLGFGPFYTPKNNSYCSPGPSVSRKFNLGPSVSEKGKPVPSVGRSGRFGPEGSNMYNSNPAGFKVIKRAPEKDKTWIFDCGATDTIHTILRTSLIVRRLEKRKFTRQMGVSQL